MNNMVEFAVALGIFAGILLTLALAFRLIARLRLPKSTNQIVLSAVMGLIFGLGSLGLILLSDKFSDWVFMAKLIYAGKISIYMFVGVLTLSSIRKNKQTNELK